jgi:hypothetical protein
MTTKKLHENVPFKDAEEIKRVVVPQSLWQLGCDDAKEGRARRHPVSHWVGGYTNGYDYGLKIRNIPGTEEEIQRHRCFDANPELRPIDNEMWKETLKAYGRAGALEERNLYIAMLKFRQLLTASH